MNDAIFPDETLWCDVWLPHADCCDTCGAIDCSAGGLSLPDPSVPGLSGYKAVIGVGEEGVQVVKGLVRDPPDYTALMALHRGECPVGGTASTRFSVTPSALDRLVDDDCHVLLIVCGSGEPDAVALATALASRLRSRARVVLGVPIGHRGCSPGAPHCHPVFDQVDAVVHLPSLAALLPAAPGVEPWEIGVAAAIVRGVMGFFSGGIIGASIDDLHSFVATARHLYAGLVLARDLDQMTHEGVIDHLWHSVASAGLPDDQANATCFWAHIGAEVGLHTFEEVANLFEKRFSISATFFCYGLTLSHAHPREFNMCALVGVWRDPKDLT